MFQMLGVFAEFERAMIQERVRAGLARAKAEGKQLGRPKITEKTERAVKGALKRKNRPGLRQIASICHQSSHGSPWQGSTNCAGHGLVLVGDVSDLGRLWSVADPTISPFRLFSRYSAARAHSPARPHAGGVLFFLFSPSSRPPSSA